MEILFFVAISVGIAEGVVQYLWLPAYFKFGVPILLGQVPAFDGAAGKRDRESVSLKKIGGGQFLVRQTRYGIARYAYCHGFVRVYPDGPDERVQCILFVDWNVLIIGAFVCSSIFDLSGLLVVSGAAVGYFFAAMMANVSRKAILTACANEMALHKQSLPGRT